MIKWKFSPSYVEQYFAKNGCERGLLVSGMTEAERKALGWEIDYVDQGNSSQKAGNEWELEGVEILKKQKKVAKKLDMRIVAEGIDTREQVDSLVEKNCELIQQGFYFAKPMPVEDFEKIAFE